MRNMKAIKFTTNIKHPCLFAEKRWVSAKENPKKSKLNTSFDPLIILFSCSIFRYQREQKYILKKKKKLMHRVEKSLHKDWIKRGKIEKTNKQFCSALWVADKSYDDYD